MKGVRKARISTRLACGCYIQVGQYEVKTPDGIWICRDCAITQQGAAAAAAAAQEESVL